MSAESRIKRVTIPEIRSRKGEEPIVSLTAYTTNVAKYLDPYVDFLLVGDSLGMILYGLESTVGVTLDMMIAHGSAVMRGAKKACVIGRSALRDVSGIAGTGVSQRGPRDDRNRLLRYQAGRRRRDGRDGAVFGRAGASRFWVHVGLMPQSVHTLGGFRAQGKSNEEAKRILADAEAIAAAGAFAIVVEGTVETLAHEITKTVPVPTIGIGASPACDGQILVSEDVMGLFSDFTPRFVKRYAELGPMIAEAGRLYAEDVRARRFPGPEHVFGNQSKKTRLGRVGASPMVQRTRGIA